MNDKEIRSDLDDLPSGKASLKKNKGDHERLANRLADILLTLFNGEKVDPQQLAEKYSTSVRTIQRDLSDRFLFLDLERDGNSYYLPRNRVGKLEWQDIRSFAALAGVSRMFPDLNATFIRELLETRTSLNFLTKGQMLEDTRHLSKHFSLLLEAIHHCHIVYFDYDGKPRFVHPYKLVHHHGSTYLAGVESDQLKAFRISKMGNLGWHSDKQTFKPDPEIVRRVQNEDSIWYTERKQEVILTVDAAVANHFLQRDLLPAQKVVKPLEDKSLIISSEVGDPLQILPLVRYWIPYVRILSPVALRDELHKEIRAYLEC